MFYMLVRCCRNFWQFRMMILKFPAQRCCISGALRNQKSIRRTSMRLSSRRLILQGLVSLSVTSVARPLELYQCQFRWLIQSRIWKLQRVVERFSSLLILVFAELSSKVIRRQLSTRLLRIMQRCLRFCLLILFMFLVVVILWRMRWLKKLRIWLVAKFGLM